MKTLLAIVLRWLVGISASQWEYALQTVSSASKAFKQNEDKRAWVIETLENVGINGSKASLLTEAAVAYLKKIGTIS